MISLLLVPGSLRAQAPAPGSPAGDPVPTEQTLPAYAPAPLEQPNAEPLAGEILAADLTRREVELVGEINRYRRQAGAPPLRWNRELSEASRWFARDATFTRPSCGHTDSRGNGPGTRLRLFGYTNPEVWGETVVCGFTEPAAAVAAWMNVAESRALLLDPAMREAGPGYAYNPEQRRGVVILKVAADPGFRPMVINDEALFTDSPSVRLTIHPPVRQALTMKISNVPTFAGAVWQPFARETTWTLAPGAGWRTVYLLARDGLGRTTLLTDMIHLGGAPPASQISLDQASNIGPAVVITDWAATDAPSVRLSLGWVLDGAPPAMTVYRGLSQVVPNPAAVGGSELVLPGGLREAYVRGVLSGLPTDRILTAYFRLKVSDNRGTGELAHLWVKAAGRTFGPVVLRPSDFAAANRWQDMGVTFAFGAANVVPDIDVELLHLGGAALTLDAVRVYGQPLPLRSPLLWAAGGGLYRSQGVQARLDAGGQVGEPFDVAFAPVDDVDRYTGGQTPLAAYPSSVVFQAPEGVVDPQNAIVVVCPLGCETGSWSATTNAPWLRLESLADGLLLTPNAAGLPRGVYDAYITVTPQTPDLFAASDAAFSALPAGDSTLEAATAVLILVRLAVGGAEAPPPPPPDTPIPMTNTYLPAIRNPAP